MDLLDKSDGEIFEIGKPFWENLVRSSNMKDYGTFTKDLDSRSGTKMKASGVLSPFFNINNAVKMIPFFGELLGGKEGEGAIGFNYKLEGTRKSPLVFINPFSILTPGILRNSLIEQ